MLTPKRVFVTSGAVLVAVASLLWWGWARSPGVPPSERGSAQRAPVPPDLEEPVTGTAAAEAREQVSEESAAAPSQSPPPPTKGVVVVTVYGFDGQPVPYGSIEFLRWRAGESMPDCVLPIRAIANTNERGVVRRELDPGLYSVAVMGKEIRRGGEPLRLLEPPFEVIAGETTEVRVGYPGGLALRGRFLLARLPWDDLRVVLKDATGRVLGWASCIDTTAVTMTPSGRFGADPFDKELAAQEGIPEWQWPGGFSFEGLAPGRYVLEVAPAWFAPLDDLEIDESGKPKIDRFFTLPLDPRLKTIRIDVTLTDEDVVLPPRRFHLWEFGLPITDEQERRGAEEELKRMREMFEPMGKTMVARMKEKMKELSEKYGWRIVEEDRR